ncbi:peptidase U37 [Prosthecomicrobium hirschii]|uniref:prohead protease/major capsid protein fusion protein n=1 Tax=Prosthecodimorpha hirschii TaxID=665126 RepID=UPI00112A0F54|nr:prohead protease/major capsid protein fusion protein [Prosthecomicrobium hirschii]TPQ48612.1 peptidase U37 [Prosthecomicrobium hirschii]
MHDELERAMPEGVAGDTMLGRAQRLAPTQTVSDRIALVESVRLKPDSFDRTARTFEAVFTTAAPVRRWFGNEILEITPDAIDLARLEAGQVRFLDHHRSNDRRAVLGIVERAWIEGDGLVGVIRLAETPEAHEAAGQIERGELTGISVGYRVDRWQITAVDETTGREDWTATRWALLEVSLVSVQADANAFVRSASPQPATGAAPSTLPRSSAAPAPPKETSMDPETIADGPRGDTPTADPTAETNVRSQEAAVRAATEAAVRAERERVAAITALASRHSLPGFGAEHVAAGTAIDAFRTALLDRLVDAEEKTPIRSTARVGQDETETRRAAAIDYLFARGLGSREATLSDAARQFLGLTTLGMAAECLEWRGESTRRMKADDIARRAMTSSDFPFLLSAVVNKELRAAYDVAPQTFRPFTRQITLPDFKLAHILRKGLAPQLKRLGEHGEYRQGVVAESEETIGLQTYGIIVAMTRQMIINDDLGAFRSIPAEFGQSAATLESDLVWGKLLANPVLKSDGTALFHATHGNLANPAAALSAEAINKGRSAMGLQTDLDKKTVLNLTPRFLLIPPELEFAAAQILTPVNAQQTANVVPEFIRSLTPIVESRLSLGVKKADDLGLNVNGSATQWLLASDRVDTVVYATMTGQSGPYVESEMGFDVDGMKIKCRHDFAAEAADFRGLYRNAGA